MKALHFYKLLIAAWYGLSIGLIFLASHKFLPFLRVGRGVMGGDVPLVLGDYTRLFIVPALIAAAAGYFVSPFIWKVDSSSPSFLPTIGLSIVVAFLACIWVHHDWRDSMLRVQMLNTEVPFENSKRWITKLGLYTLAGLGGGVSLIYGLTFGPALVFVIRALRGR